MCSVRLNGWLCGVCWCVRWFDGGVGVVGFCCDV